MFGRNREMMFYVEGEFLFDDFKWFSCDFTFDDSSQESINVLLGYFKSNDLFIVLGYGERLEVLTVKGLLFFGVPVPSLLSYLFLCHGEVFLCYCLIVAKGRELVGEEFSPLTGRDHVVYDLRTQLFVFGGRVGGIEDAVFLMLQGDTSKTIRT
jgi:hypothetical protein